VVAKRADCAKEGSVHDTLNPRKPDSTGDRHVSSSGLSTSYASAVGALVQLVAPSQSLTRMLPPPQDTIWRPSRPSRSR
jgi:hypothetical protein